MNKLLLCALTILMFGVKIDAVISTDRITRPNFKTIMKKVNPSATDAEIQGLYEAKVVSKQWVTWADPLKEDRDLDSVARTKVAMGEVPLQK